MSSQLSGFKSGRLLKTKIRASSMFLPITLILVLEASLFSNKYRQFIVCVLVKPLLFFQLYFFFTFQLMPDCNFTWKRFIFSGKIANNRTTFICYETFLLRTENNQTFTEQGKRNQFFPAVSTKKNENMQINIFFTSSQNLSFDRVLTC